MEQPHGHKNSNNSSSMLSSKNNSKVIQNKKKRTTKQDQQVPISNSSFQAGKHQVEGRNHRDSPGVQSYDQDDFEEVRSYNQPENEYNENENLDPSQLYGSQEERNQTHSKNGSQNLNSKSFQQSQLHANHSQSEQHELHQSGHQNNFNHNQEGVGNDSDHKGLAQSFHSNQSQERAGNSDFEENKSSGFKQSYHSTKQTKKSEIEGNPSSWNHIEYNEEGDPVVVKEQENHYHNYINQNQSQQHHPTGGKQEHKPLKAHTVNEELDASPKNSPQKINKKSEIFGNSSSWNHIAFNEEGDPVVVKESKNHYEDYVNQKQKQQKEIKKKSLGENQIIIKQDQQQSKKKIKANHDSTNSQSEQQQLQQQQLQEQQTSQILPQKINLTYEEYMKQQNGFEEDQPESTHHMKSHFEQDSTQNYLKDENPYEVDQRSAYDPSVRSNNNMNFDNQTIQDDELRGEYEDEMNTQSIMDDRLSTKKMMLSDKSFKIDLILNHQPAINPENHKYANNKERFQLFFQRNAENIMRQIQKQGSYRNSTNEYVIKFADFQSFISKIFDNDNFTIIESDQHLQNIMKNKNISLILSTILKEFLKTVRKVNDKMLVDVKNIELGVEDMMDFFEFWIRVDDQLQVKYDAFNNKQDSSKTVPLQISQSHIKESQKGEEKQQKQSNYTQARLQSLLEGNIKRLESIQNDSIKIDVQQQNIINQTLQFLKSQYKKFEKKTLEEQQNEKVSNSLSDSDISSIQNQIMNLFKEYSTLFSSQTKKYTFDEISQSHNYMNINNFFKFVKDFGIQNEKVQGAQIIEIFNRNCTGKQMNYSQYVTSLLKIVEIKENCVFIEQKTQIIAIAKMLKLKISFNGSSNSKETGNKVKKYAFETSSSTKSSGSQNRSLSPKNSSLQSKPPSQPESDSSKLNWSDLEKLSYQQINNLGSKKNVSPPPHPTNQSPQKIRPIRRINEQLTAKGDEQNKKNKNLDDNFNPNDLIDVDDEHETNDLLEKQYRITKQGMNKKNSDESPKLPPISGAQSEQSSKPHSEVSSQKDSQTNVRMVKQLKKIPKAQSTSPPPNQQGAVGRINPIQINSPRPNGVNSYSTRFKNNLQTSPKRGSQSPNLRVSKPLQLKPGFSNKQIPESAEKQSKMLPDRNLLQLPQQQQLQQSQQLNVNEEKLQEDTAIQDAILKSTHFRNFLKNKALQIQNDMLTTKPIQQDGIPLTKSGVNDQQQNHQFIPPQQSYPPYSQLQQQQNLSQQPQLQQQNQHYKKNNMQQYPQQQSQMQQQQQQQQQQQPQQLQYMSPIIQPQQVGQSNNAMPQNMIGGNYSFGKNQMAMNQHLNNNAQMNDIANSPLMLGYANQIENHMNNPVRVVPVMNHQQFNLDKQ